MLPQKMPPGLELFENYVDEETEAWILKELSKRLWVRGKSDFQLLTFWSVFNGIDTQESAPDNLRVFCQGLANRFKKEHLTEKIINTCFIHAYQPWDGINPHIDSPEFIGESVITLNLNDGITMEFVLGQEKIEVFYPPRSLAVMRGPSRYEYTHGIPYQDYDLVNGVKLPRGKRFGILWRHEDKLASDQAIAALPLDTLQAIRSDPKILELQQQLRQIEDQARQAKENLKKSEQQLEDSRRRLKEQLPPG